MAQTSEQLKRIELSLAYMGAFGIISDYATQIEGAIDTFDTRDVRDEGMSALVGEAVDYLESRHLISRDPAYPGTITIQDEDEPLTAAESAAA